MKASNKAKFCNYEQKVPRVQRFFITLQLVWVYVQLWLSPAKTKPLGWKRSTA